MRSVQLNIAVFCALLTSFGASASPGKYTVCSATINSSNEINAFKKVLGTKKFEYVELTNLKTPEDQDDEGQSKPLQPEWLDVACKKQIHCDILLVSGHFGGKFFGETGLELSLDDLEIASCDKGCNSALQAPKEVFLFGCNTLAGKNQDARTPEQYRDALLSHGFDSETAEQMVAFRYSSFGDSFAERMAGVFRNTPRIYGFDSSAPLGKNVDTMLVKYLRQAEKSGYYSKGKFLTAGSSVNAAWKSALRSTSTAQSEGLGEQKYQSAVCFLHSPKRPMTAKFKWIEEALTGPNMLAHLPYINSFISSLLTSDYSESGDWDDRNFEFFENIKKFSKAKQVMDDMIARNFEGILAMQMNALKFERSMGWISEKTMLDRSAQLLYGTDETKWSRARVDTVVSIRPGSLRIELSEASFPRTKFRDPLFMEAVSPVETVTPGILRKYIEISEDKSADAKLRNYALTALLSSQRQPVAHAYILSLIHRGGDGLLRLVATGSGIHSGDDIFAALSSVIDNESTSSEKAYAAGRMFRGTSPNPKALARIEYLVNRSLREAATSELSLESSSQLCRNVAFFMSRSERFPLRGKLERQGALKIAISCTDPYDYVIFAGLREQEDIEADILDTFLAAKDSMWNRVLHHSPLGTTMMNHPIDIRQFPKTGAKVFNKWKTVNPDSFSLAKAEGLFLLATAEGQKYLFNAALRSSADKPLPWQLISYPELNESYRLQLVNMLMQRPAHQWNRGALLMAVISSPVWAEAHLQTATRGMQLNSALSGKEVQFAAMAKYLGREDLIAAVLKLSRDPRTGQDVQVPLGELLSMARPESPQTLKALREVAKDQRLSKAIRDGATMALLNVNDSSVNEDSVRGIAEPSAYKILKFSVYRDRLETIATSELKGPNRFRAIKFLLDSDNRKTADGHTFKNLYNEFIDFESTHHDRTRDYTGGEMILLTNLRARNSKYFTEKMTRLVRAEDISSESNVSLAWLVLQGSSPSSPAIRVICKFISTASWEDFGYPSPLAGAEGTVPSVVQAAMIARLKSATTVEQIGRLEQLFYNLWNTLSLHSKAAIRDYQRQLNDPVMAATVRKLWPADVEY